MTTTTTTTTVDDFGMEGERETDGVRSVGRRRQASNERCDDYAATRLSVVDAADTHTSPGELLVINGWVTGSGAPSGFRPAVGN